MASNVKQVFDNLKKRCYNTAQRRMTAGLPAAIEDIHRFAREKMAELEKSDMTGNYINGFGIAIYRDGEFIACATSHEVEGKDPIQVTLTKGEKFMEGRTRYDGSTQEDTFTAPEGIHHIMADQEVVNWLRRYPPRVSKKGPSLSYRIVSIVDYAKFLGGDKVLLSLADSIEGRGGTIKEFRFS
jgi:hypothetical protein